MILGFKYLFSYSIWLFAYSIWLFLYSISLFSYAIPAICVRDFRYLRTLFGFLRIRDLAICVHDFLFFI